MELNKPLFFQYDLTPYWDSFLELNNYNINQVNSELRKIKEEIEKSNTSEFTKEIREIVPNELESLSLKSLKFIIGVKQDFNKYHLGYSDYLIIDEANTISVEKVLNKYFNNQFKQNYRYKISEIDIEIFIKDYEKYISSYYKLGVIIHLWNESFVSGNPSLQQATIDNLEILAYNSLLQVNKNQKAVVESSNITIESLKKLVKERSDEYFMDLKEKRENHFEEIKQLRQDFEDKIQLLEKQNYDLNQQYSNLSFELNFRKENFMKFSVLKVDIPGVRLLYNILAPLNLLYANNGLDFTKFCWFLDAIKFQSSNQEKILVDFRKGSVTAGEFGKFLYYIKVYLFKEDIGHSFENWIKLNFHFTSSHGKEIDMNRYIRKYPNSSSPSQDKFEKFYDYMNIKE